MLRSEGKRGEPRNRVEKESQEEPKFWKLQQGSARFKYIDLLAEIAVGVKER